ncbi:MAG: hypothetical protein KDF65_09030 [Anaerolineae bacterium]|nr:hypothetical protein [Anaerolineae bacterium]
MSASTFDQAIETVMQLPLEQQEMLVDIIRSRHIDRRRREIARDAQESIAAFRAGKLKSQPAETVITDLRNSLEQVDEE